MIRRGVIFSGATREPIARGFTRPHSARLFEKQIWVDNSGYGEFGVVQDNKFVSVASLPGWTRGLCFARGVAFVGTSCVIDRFRNYAPGLNPDECECGIHAIDARTGAILGSMIWPQGNQVFAIDWLPEKITSGFPFGYGAGRSDAGEKALFYSFRTNLSEDRK